MPNETIKLHPYINGKEYLNAQITEKTGCVNINQNTITGSSPVKKSEIDIICGDYSKTLNLSVNLIPLTYDVDKNEENIFITLASEYLKNTALKVTLVFFNKDHSIKNMQVFDADFDNGTEIINSENYFEDEAYAKILVWKDMESQVCLTKVITLK